MKQSKQSSIVRKSPVLTSVALACALFAGNAHAGWPVIDPTHIAAQVVKFGQDYAKFAKDIAHFKSEIDHMTQQLTDLSKIVDTATIGLAGGGMLSNIPKRAAAYGIERCDQNSGGGGFNPLQLLSGFLGGGSGNYIQKQKELCEQTVYLENAKYNELVDSLKRLRDMKEKGVDQVTQNAKGSSKNGQMDTTGVTATAVLGQIEVETAYVEALLQTYDGMIAATNQEIKNVAQDALKGKKKNMLESIVSDVAQTALISTALNAQKSTCPSGFTCN